MTNQLIGITYSEFDNDVGPQLLYQYPDGIMSLKSFECVSDYVIVGKHLCEQIIVIKYDQIQFMNFSVAIENAKYGRNTLSFAIGFVVGECVDTEPYEPVLRKLAATLVALEIEVEYLFNPSSKSMLEKVLRWLYEGLVENGEAYVQMDSANMLAVKLYRSPEEIPPVIRDYDVPMMLQDKSLLARMPWDITVNRILPYIDNQACVRKIAADADVDIICAKQCLRVLVFYECVIISDIFQFSNMYISTPRALDLADESKLKEVELYSAHKPDVLPKRENIFRFILSLRPGVTIRELIASNPKLLRDVNVPRLLGIAQHRKLINRIYEYPVLKKETVGSKSTEDRPRSTGSHTTSKVKGLRVNPVLAVNTNRDDTWSSNRSSAGGSKQLSQESYCGPSTDEICCVADICRADLDESKCVFVLK